MQTAGSTWSDQWCVDGDCYYDDAVACCKSVCEIVKPSRPTLMVLNVYNNDMYMGLIRLRC